MKFDIYQQQKVKYYLLADSATNAIKIYEHGENGYADYSSADFHLNDQCSIKLDLKELSTQ